MKNESIITKLREDTEYQDFFKRALDKAGQSIPSMSDEEKKAFFNKIDAAWNGKKEKREVTESEEYDEWRNTRTQAKNIFRMLKQKHNNNPMMMRADLERILKQNHTEDDQAEVIWDEFKKYFKIK